jgi:hypothetical protein
MRLYSSRQLATVVGRQHLLSLELVLERRQETVRMDEERRSDGVRLGVEVFGGEQERSSSTGMGVQLQRTAANTRKDGREEREKEMVSSSFRPIHFTPRHLLQDGRSRRAHDDVVKPRLPLFLALKLGNERPGKEGTFEQPVLLWGETEVK